MNKEKPICLFDMDGVLAGYAEQLAMDFNKIKHPSEKVYSIEDLNPAMQEPEWFYNRRSHITEREEWWVNLPLIQSGFELLTLCEKIGFRIEIMTCGPRGKPEAWSGKVKWIDKHFPHINDITITRDKSTKYGKVLIDDFPDYCENWLSNRPRGLVVMPERPWNMHSKAHPNIYKYNNELTNSLELVSKQLQQANDR